MTRAKHNIKRVLAVLLAIMILFFIMAETQPTARAEIITISVIALIVALMTAAGVIFATETQAQQLAEHVYWQTRDTIDWHQMVDMEQEASWTWGSWVELGAHVIDGFPAGTAVAQFSALQFQAKINLIRGVFEQNVPEFTGIEFASMGELTNLELGNPARWMTISSETYYIWGINPEWNSEIIVKPLADVSIFGHSVVSELREFGVGNTGGLGIYTNNTRMLTFNRRPPPSLYNDLINGRIVFGMTLNPRVAADQLWFVPTRGSNNGTLGLVRSGVYILPLPLSEMIARSNQQLGINNPPWQQWSCWDTFLAEGYNPDLHPELDLIESIMTGDGYVDLLVQPIIGTGAIGVQNPDGESMTWEDAVSRPGTWTEPEIGENQWTLEELQEAFPEAHVRALGGGFVVETDDWIMIIPKYGQPLITPKGPPAITVEVMPGMRTIVIFDGIITTPLNPRPGMNMDDIVIVADGYEVIMRPDRTTGRQRIPVKTKEVEDTDIVIVVDDNNVIIISIDGGIRMQPKEDTGTPPGTDTGNPPITDVVTPAPPSQSPGVIFAMFPFCIPWDVYNIIQALTVAPIEPRFEFDMFPFVDADTTLSINFDEFGTIIQIVRWGFLISFIIGLAAVTRRYIWTGGG